VSRPESAARALSVATGVAFVCSLIVSGTVYWLRPIQLAYSGVERNRAVLVAAGLAGPDESLADRDVVSRFLDLDPQLADLDGAALIDADAGTIADYDYRIAAGDPGRSRAIPPALDIASLGRRPLLMPVYLQRDRDGLAGIVLPVYGRGMWSEIHGYIALQSDLSTIARVWFYELGETPGIGDRIQEPEWLAQWSGKRVYGEDGSLLLGIGGPADAARSQRVDSISGATVTVSAVDRFVRYWLGENGYRPLLENLRAGG